MTKLLKSGRIDRQFADADRRRSILNLSEKGREVHDRVAKLALEFEKNLLDGLDDADIESFDKVMDKLLARALKP